MDKWTVVDCSRQECARTLRAHLHAIEVYERFPTEENKQLVSEASRNRIKTLLAWRRALTEAKEESNGQDHP